MLLNLLAPVLYRKIPKRTPTQSYKYDHSCKKAIQLCSNSCTYDKSGRLLSNLYLNLWVLFFYRLYIKFVRKALQCFPPQICYISWSHAHTHTHTHIDYHVRAVWTRRQFHAWLSRTRSQLQPLSAGDDSWAQPTPIVGEKTSKRKDRQIIEIWRAKLTSELRAL